MLDFDCHAHILWGDEKRYPPKDHPLRPPDGKAFCFIDYRRDMNSGVVGTNRDDLSFPGSCAVSFLPWEYSLAH
jgi:hypothetical protein